MRLFQGRIGLMILAGWMAVGLMMGNLFAGQESAFAAGTTASVISPEEYDALFTKTDTEGEGEEEEPVTYLEQVQLLTPAGNIKVSEDTEVLSVLFSARVTVSDSLPAGYAVTTWFEINSTLYPAELRNGVYYALIQLPTATTYKVRAKAEIEDNDAESLFSALRTCVIDTTEDSDANGYADDPFAALTVPGNAWYSYLAADGCSRSTIMVDLAPSSSASTTYLTFPTTDALVMKARVPAGLVELGERAILVLSMACTETALLQPDATGPAESERPGEAVTDGAFIAVSLLVSTDDGETFDEISTDRLEEYPIELEWLGISPKAGFDTALWAFPATVTSNADTGISVIPDAGDWNRKGFYDVIQTIDDEDILSVRLNKTGVFAPFQTGRPAVLTVSPGGETESYSYGIIAKNQAMTQVFTVTNTGSTPITGKATLSDKTGMYWLQQPSTYTLEPDTSEEIRLQFTPTSIGHFGAALTFTGGVNGPIVLDILGDGTEKAPKTASSIGCGGSAGASPLGWGDMAVLLLTGLLLTLLPQRKES